MNENDSDVAKILQTLNENPALVGQIRALFENAQAETAAQETPQAAAVSGESESGSSGRERNDGTRVEKSAEKGIPVLRSLLGQERLIDDRREQLLRALKPYLSDARGGMIDTAITLGKMLDSVRRA